MTIKCDTTCFDDEVSTAVKSAKAQQSKTCADEMADIEFAVVACALVCEAQQ